MNSAPVQRWYESVLRGEGLSENKIKARSEERFGDQDEPSVTSNRDAMRVMRAFGFPGRPSTVHLTIVAMLALFPDGRDWVSVVPLKDIRVTITPSLDNEENLVVTMVGELRSDASITFSVTRKPTTRAILSRHGNDAPPRPSEFVTPSMLLNVMRNLVFRRRDQPRDNMKLMAQFVTIPIVRSAELKHL